MAEFSASSRYAGQPVRERAMPDGRRVGYVLPRRAPPPEAYTPGMPHPVARGDRLDLLAYRLLGEPTAWWMIADINAAVKPDTLLDTPGETIATPLPGGAPPERGGGGS